MSEQTTISKELLSAKNVFCIYKGKENSSNVVALRGINLDMKIGESIAIVGPSGSGKSSLLRILGGLQHPSAGSVSYFGTDITRLPEESLVDFRRATVGYVFQEHNLQHSISAYQNVFQTLRFAGKSRKEAKTRAIELLDKLGVKSRMHDLPTRLSGGERQRVSISRALANNPAIILADEPTGNIDFANTEIVMGLFKDLNKELSMSSIIVTHSKFVASFADRSVELRDGRFIAEHSKDFDISDLEKSRQIIISPDGTLNLPPELIELILSFGDLWNFQLKMENDKPRLVATPHDSSYQNVEGNKKSLTSCPVCGTEVATDQYFCKSCGGKLK